MYVYVCVCMSMYVYVCMCVCVCTVCVTFGMIKIKINDGVGVDPRAGSRGISRQPHEPTSRDAADGNEKMKFSNFEILNPVSFERKTRRIDGNWEVKGRGGKTVERRRKRRDYSTSSSRVWVGGLALVNAE